MLSNGPLNMGIVIWAPKHGRCDMGPGTWTLSHKYIVTLDPHRSCTPGSTGSPDQADQWMPGQNKDQRNNPKKVTGFDE